MFMVSTAKKEMHCTRLFLASPSSMGEKKDLQIAVRAFVCVFLMGMEVNYTSFFSHVECFSIYPKVNNLKYSDI